MNEENRVCSRNNTLHIFCQFTVHGKGNVMEKSYSEICCLGTIANVGLNPIIFLVYQPGPFACIKISTATCHKITVFFATLTSLRMFLAHLSNYHITILGSKVLFYKPFLGAKAPLQIAHVSE